MASQNGEKGYELQRMQAYTLTYMRGRRTYTHGIGGSLVTVEGGIGELPWAWSEDSSVCRPNADCQNKCHQHQPKHHHHPRSKRSHSQACSLHLSALLYQYHMLMLSLLLHACARSYIYIVKPQALLDINRLTL